MAGFLSKLFGSFSGGSGGGEGSGSAREHMQKIGEYTVFATPRREGSQFRLAGRIEHETDTGKLVRTFVRADLFASETDTVETTFRKAKQIIEQHGQTLFGDGASERQV
jgi:hypothetical protein